LSFFITQKLYGKNLTETLKLNSINHTQNLERTPTAITQKPNQKTRKLAQKNTQNLTENTQKIQKTHTHTHTHTNSFQNLENQS